MLTSSSVSMIKKAIQSKEQVFLSADNLPITFQTRLLKITQDFLVVYNAITPEYISKAITSRNFSLQIANLRFQAKKISSNGEHILFPTDKSTATTDARQEKRLSFSESENVHCKIINPYDKETILKKPVIDLSASGVSIRNIVESKLFSSGTHLQDIKIFVNNELRTQQRGEVVYSRKLLNIKKEFSIQVGIKFL